MAFSQGFCCFLLFDRQDKPSAEPFSLELIIFGTRGNQQVQRRARVGLGWRRDIEKDDYSGFLIPQKQASFERYQCMWRWATVPGGSRMCFWKTDFSPGNDISL